jgi:uncharacterized protein (TIRG00374 family)
MTRDKGWWIRLIFNLLVLALLVWAVLSFPWAETLAALKNTRLWLLAVAAFVHLLCFVAKGWAWQLLLNPVARTRWWVTQEANMVGTAINNVSVMLVGEGTRANILHDRDQVPYGIAYASILWARALEGVGFVVLYAFVLFFLHLPRVYYLFQIVAFVALGAVALVYLVRDWLARRFAPVGRWWKRAREAFFSRSWVQTVGRHTPRSVKKSLHALVEIPLVTHYFPWIILLTIANWIFEWIDVDLTFRAIGEPISNSASFAIVTLTNIAWLLRITPGNVGILQGAVVVALLPFGVPPAVAVVGGIVLQAVQAIPPLLMAAISAGAAKLETRREKRMGGRRRKGRR